MLRSVMRTLGQSLLVAVLLAVGMGTLAAQTDVEALRAKAKQGDASAQFHLGFMYNTGRGVPQDYVQAHMWVTLAASTSQGEENERYAKPRKMIAENMTSAQIAEAQRLAREWKSKTWDELKQGLKGKSR
jgi:TPR repeat protein